MVGVVRVIYLIRMAEIISGSSLEPNNPTEHKLGFWRVKMTLRRELRPNELNGVY